MLADFFTIEDELGPKILQIVPAKVSEAEMRRIAQRHTRNLEAYEYFQRGQHALQARQKEENETARELFRHAIALDATFARAYAGLARTYAADYRQQWTTDDAAAPDRAFELATTAYQMDRTCRRPTGCLLRYTCSGARTSRRYSTSKLPSGITHRSLMAIP